MLNEILTTIEAAESGKDRQFVVALARGLSILYTTRFYPHGVSYQQICEKTDLPQATVSRLLHTLMRLRFIRQNPQTSLYQADSRLLEMLSSVHLINPTEQVRSLMAEFAVQHQVSVSLAHSQYGEMLYVQCIRSPARIAVQLQVGSTVPMADTAIGRAYYVALTSDQQQTVQRELRLHYPNNYAEKIAFLEAHTDFAKTHGYTVSDREFSKDIVAIAVTVHHPLAPHGIYAINASAPSSRMSQDKLIEEVARPLQELAKRIQQQMTGD